MNGPMNVKFVDANQTKETYQYIYIYVYKLDTLVHLVGFAIEITYELTAVVFTELVIISNTRLK